MYARGGRRASERPEPIRSERPRAARSLQGHSAGAPLQGAGRSGRLLIYGVVGPLVPFGRRGVIVTLCERPLPPSL